MLEIEVIFFPFILCWVVEKSAREIGKIKNWQKFPSAPNWSSHVSMFGNGFSGLSTFCWQVISLENDRHFSPYYPTSHDPGLEECKLSVMSKSWGQIKLRAKWNYGCSHWVRTYSIADTHYWACLMVVYFVPSYEKRNEREDIFESRVENES